VEPCIEWDASPGFLLLGNMLLTGSLLHLEHVGLSMVKNSFYQQAWPGTEMPIANCTPQSMHLTTLEL